MVRVAAAAGCARDARCYRRCGFGCWCAGLSDLAPAVGLVLLGWLAPRGAAAGVGVSATEMGDAVGGGGVDGSNDARAPILVELAWSGELLNCAPAWGGNWLRWARGGRSISELHSSYPVGYPAGLDAE